MDDTRCDSVLARLYGLAGPHVEAVMRVKGTVVVDLVKAVKASPNVNWEPYFHGLAGYFQEMAEQASHRRVANTITDRGDSFEMTYRW